MTSVARPRGPVAVQGRPAGIVTRLVAAGVDLLVVLATVAALDLGYAALRYLLLGPPFVLPDLGPWGALGYGAAVMAGYLAVSWGTAGRTVGDHVLGVRVTSRSGSLLTPVAAVLRALLYVIFPLGLLWVAVGRRRASVQDLLVRSVVVYDWYGHAGATAARPHA
ncbi:RDD family protein [Streptomyces sp. NPDC059680]|uniref:RDD family protein n=1 Tax=Streptomyces TaxID=1883 RepID=UPI001E369201|nr:RDD family protein [Streptomyces barringtoniae]MCC5473774.1 RDD family protein [Streptomyces barringtoniae]